MGGGILGGEYKPDKPGWRTSSWGENIKLGGEHKVERRTSSWVANRKLGGKYKSWMENIKLGGNMWCTQVGDRLWWVVDTGGRWRQVGGGDR